MATLVFIDTNIWLDFYRVRGKQADLSLLEKIDALRPSIISTVQVEMEFKKNRPRAILEAYQGLQVSELSQLQMPAFLAQSKQSSGIETGKKRIKGQLSTLRSRTEALFKDPTRRDPVYKIAQRVFRSDSPHNLKRTRKERHSNRRLACKRFVLGYPPRKAGDTSVGDAINWEWIIRCANESGADVVIVSRDSDFGVRFAGHPHLNDWLRQEFAERVSRTRKIELTDRLSEGLRRAEVPVTDEEEKAEEVFLRERPSTQRAVLDEIREALLKQPFAYQQHSSAPLRSTLADYLLSGNIFDHLATSEVSGSLGEVEEE